MPIIQAGIGDIYKKPSIKNFIKKLERKTRDRKPIN